MNAQAVKLKPEAAPEMDPLAKLREPFPPHQISKLPKPFKKDAPKGKCAECGGYHGLPAALLHYVAQQPDRVKAFLLQLAQEDVRAGKRQIPGVTVTEEKRAA